MEILEFQLYVKDINQFRPSDIKDMEFMTDAELDEYQKELEHDTGNLSDYDHLRAVITFRKKMAELERLQRALHILKDSGLYIDAQETYEALPKVCEAILNNEEWSI